MISIKSVRLVKSIEVRGNRHLGDGLTAGQSDVASIDYIDEGFFRVTFKSDGDTILVPREYCQFATPAETTFLKRPTPK